MAPLGICSSCNNEPHIWPILKSYLISKTHLCSPALVGVPVLCHWPPCFHSCLSPVYVARSLGKLTSSSLDLSMPSILPILWLTSKALPGLPAPYPAGLRCSSSTLSLFSPVHQVSVLLSGTMSSTVHGWLPLILQISDRYPFFRIPALAPQSKSGLATIFLVPLPPDPLLHCSHTLAILFLRWSGKSPSLSPELREYPGLLCFSSPLALWHSTNVQMNGWVLVLCLATFTSVLFCVSFLYVEPDVTWPLLSFVATNCSSWHFRGCSPACKFAQDCLRSPEDQYLISWRWSLSVLPPCWGPPGSCPSPCWGCYHWRCLGVLETLSHGRWASFSWDVCLPWVNAMQ